MPPRSIRSQSRSGSDIYIRTCLRQAPAQVLQPCEPSVLFRCSLLVTLGPAADKPNVLLILVDDLKPSFGAYGESWVHSPNLDRLAARGMRFDRAYCNQAVCAPRGTTCWSVRGPLRSASTVLATIFAAPYLARHVAPALQSERLPLSGDRQGFPHRTRECQRREIVERSLSSRQGRRLCSGGKHRRAIDARGGLFQQSKLGENKSLPRGAAWEIAEVEDGAYADGRIASEGIERLRGYKASGQPFFLALGFTKPHLPFCARKKYWDLYDRRHFRWPVNQSTRRRTFLRRKDTG